MAVVAIAGVHLQTTQGTYEDHAQVSPYRSLTAPAPPFWRARGLTQRSIWWQARRAASPASMRAVNLGLFALVAIMVGAWAAQLGAPGWFAAALLACHPLATEAIASLSGRGELIAALGVATACAIAASGRLGAWRLAAIALALGVGYLGKETAALGLALVPLTAMRAGVRRAGWALAAGLAAVLAAAWSIRGAGLTTTATQYAAGAWALRQSGAAVRLLLLVLIPRHQTVDFDVDALAWAWCLASGVYLAGLAVWAAGRWRASRALAYGLAWTLIVIAPRLIVVTPKSYLNEHQFFLALAGLAVGGAMLAGKGRIYGDR